MQFSTWSFPRLVVAMAFVGVLLGTGFAWLLPSEYTSKATLQLTPAEVQTIFQLQSKVLSRTSLSQIVNDPELLLYKDQLKETPLEDVIEGMKRNIRIQIVALPGNLGKRASAFDIDFTYTDRWKAQRTVQKLMDAFMANLQERSAGASTESSNGSLFVLDTPNLPLSPVYPNPRVLMAVGFLAGILVALLWRLIQRRGFIARRFALIATAFGIVGFAAVYTGDRLEVLPYQYVSTAVLQVPGGQPGRLAALRNEALSRTSLSAIINDPRIRLYGQELQSTPLEDVIRGMQQNIHIGTIAGGNGTQMFIVSFKYADRYKAQQVVSMMLERIIAADALLYPNPALMPKTTPAQLSVLDMPSLPAQPTKPNRPMIAFAGGIIGLIAGAIITLVRRRWMPQGTVPMDAVNG